MSTTYEKIPGCEVPVATRRVVNPEIEGHYKIKFPTKSVPLKNNQLTSNLDRPTVTSNRIVILSDDSKLDVKSNLSILKRLGESLEKYEKLTKSTIDCDDDKNVDLKISVKKPKIQIADNKTILKRFFNASLSRDSHTKFSLSEKLPLKNIIQTTKGSVFLRLGNQDDEDEDENEDDDVDDEETVRENSGSLPYMGVFKLPNVTNIKSDRIKVRSGHTTESIRKVEATSTTSNFQSIRIDVNSNKIQSIKDRLGHR